MPWNLTTDVATGDLAGADYGEVKIRRQTWDDHRKSISVDLAYGNTDAGPPEVFNEGHLPEGKVANASWDGTEYDDFIAAAQPKVVFADPSDANYVNVPASGGDPEYWVERTYVAVKRGLYEQMETDGTIAAGTVS